MPCYLFTCRNLGKSGLRVSSIGLGENLTCFKIKSYLCQWYMIVWSSPETRPSWMLFVYTCIKCKISRIYMNMYFNWNWKSSVPT